jgi:hypothetical protein
MPGAVRRSFRIRFPAATDGRAGWISRRKEKKKPSAVMGKG